VGEVFRLVIFVALICTGAAYANQRSAELLDAFQTLCTPGPPDFAALDAKATALKLAVREDIVAPPQSGRSAHRKSWLMTLADGSHELVAAETQDPNGGVVSCGIGADDVDGEEMKRDLLKAMKLEAPVRDSASADGTQRLTVWKYADDINLLLVDATPMKIPGIYVTLQHQMKTSR
jgi:hypothetical protein